MMEKNWINQDLDVQKVANIKLMISKYSFFIFLNFRILNEAREIFGVDEIDEFYEEEGILTYYWLF